MSVLIKDMEKPKSCFEIIDGDFEYCPFVNTDDDCVLLLKKGICNVKWKEQYSKCPLVEVLEPCEDALKKIKKASFVGSDGLDYVETLQALDALKDAIGVTLHVTKISKHCSDFSDLDEVIECEDAVSRAELLSAFPVDDEATVTKSSLRMTIKHLPSVAPKRKTGKWIHSDFSHEFLHCSECGRGRYFCSNFCPNCGADMRSETE